MLYAIRMLSINCYRDGKITRGMQSIVGRAELAIDLQPHRRAAELSGFLHIVLLYEVGIR